MEEGIDRPSGHVVDSRPRKRLVAIGVLFRASCRARVGLPRPEVYSTPRRFLFGVQELAPACRCRGGQPSAGNDTFQQENLVIILVGTLLKVAHT